MRTKHCKWGTCTSDSRYLPSDTSIIFRPFPKPCKLYRNDSKDPTLLVKHDVSQCDKCSKAQSWINACRVEGFSSLLQINSNCYVCSLHFAASGAEIPLTAGSHPSTTSKRRNSPKQRNLIHNNVSPPKSDDFNASGATCLVPSAAALDIVNHDHTYSKASIQESPGTLKRRISEMVDFFEGEKRHCSKKIKLLQQAVRRKAAKITKVSELLHRMVEESMLDDNLESLLRENFSGVKLALLTSEFANSHKSTNREYSEEVKKFSQTLFFLSPRAYKFAREHFCLPHPSTLRRWCSVDGRPGWTQESLDELARDDDKTDCILIVDGMHVKKGTQWCPSVRTMVGYVDYGSGPPPKAPLATEALIVLVVGLVKPWRMPIGYFLHAGLTSKTMASIVKEAIRRLHVAGVRTWGLVFDGARNNISMASILGASLPERPYFPSPVAAVKVYIFLDNCHMFKLIRNLMADFRELSDAKGRSISWSLIELLLRVQLEEGLHAGNRLTKCNVLEWHRQKMKVKNAVKVLSRSTADAIHFCNQSKVPGFEDVEGTCHFIRQVDEVFDILNSRSPFAKGSKQVLRPGNLDKVKKIFAEAEDMLRSLKSKDHTLVITSKRKTCVIGYITTMRATILMAEEIFQLKPCLKYLMTYRWCQDPIEHFIGDLRLHCGWCNNPTCWHIYCAYRRLVHHRLPISHLSQNRNCVYFPDRETSDSLEKASDEVDLDAEDDMNEALLMAFDSLHISEFRLNILYYMAGNFATRLQSSLQCFECVAAVTSDAKDALLAESALLTRIKNRGGLRFPSDSVFRVVCICDRAFSSALQLHPNKPPSDATFARRLERDILAAVSADRRIFKDLDGHALDCHSCEQHVPRLCKTICTMYINARMRHMASTYSKEMAGQNLRSTLTRTVIFRNL